MQHKRTPMQNFLLLYLPLFVILLFLLFPFYWTFATSIKPEAELYGSVVTYWPHNLAFESYRKLLVDSNFLKPMGNSFVVAIITALITLTVSVLASYPFSRFRLAGRKAFMVLLLANNMFPTVLLLIPLYAIMRSMDLLYTSLSLVLSYTTFTIPFSIWLLNGFINDLPLSLEETATVDGCNRAQTSTRIIFPVLMSYPVATGVYIFMTSWNEYTFAVVLTNERNRITPMALKDLIGQLGVQWDLLTAGGIITITPVCIMFFFVQKYSVEGLATGTVKG